MVQTVYYYLDSNCEKTYYNNAMILSQAGKLTSQKKYPPSCCIEASKMKCKNAQVKLQPLGAKVENNVILNNTERKFSHRLNTLPTKPQAVSDQKKLCSKIPVLQKKTVLSKKPKSNYIQNDASLSAADRRQKFHQSRLRPAGICSTDISGVKKNQNLVHCDLLPCYEGYIVHKIFAPSTPAVNLKSILPPIKPLEITTETMQKSNQQKSKCLLGEITHFPALCNPMCSKQRKKNTSTVPHLPPILPPPVAPPPSISTSLEKDGNQGKMQIINTKNCEDWNFSKNEFYKLTAV